MLRRGSKWFWLRDGQIYKNRRGGKGCVWVSFRISVSAEHFHQNLRIVDNVDLSIFSIVYLCSRKSDKKLLILKEIPMNDMTTEERAAALNEVQILKVSSN